MIELSYGNLIRLGDFICKKIAKSEDIEEIRNYFDLKYLVDDRIHEREVSDTNMDEEPKPLTEYDIIHLVGKPLWVDDGTFKCWRVLKAIHINKDTEFILNFTDNQGGYALDELKCYQGEL